MSIFSLNGFLSLSGLLRDLGTDPVNAIQGVRNDIQTAVRPRRDIGCDPKALPDQQRFALGSIELVPGRSRRCSERQRIGYSVVGNPVRQPRIRAQIKRLTI